MSEITLTYETACARIEEIIRRLDSGEAGLRETLELCQEGRKLVEFCAGELEAVGAASRSSSSTSWSPGSRPAAPPPRRSRWLPPVVGLDQAGAQREQRDLGARRPPRRHVAAAPNERPRWSSSVVTISSSIPVAAAISASSPA